MSRSPHTIRLILLFFAFSFCKEQSISNPSIPDIVNEPIVTSFPPLAWPFEDGLDHGIYLMNYADMNTNNGKLDISCSDHNYDGHTGIDYTVYSFREMDKGHAILSATDGQVTSIRFDQFDRTYEPPYVHQPNFVLVTHSDGSTIGYWHMRKNSVAVNIGETVKKGDFLGYIGSSGATPIPHLHLDLRETFSGQRIYRDPYSGECNDFESLWENDYDNTYIGDDPLKIYEIDITNNLEKTGTWQLNLDMFDIKDRLVRPAVYGINENKLGVWALFQGNLGQSMTFEIFKPDGSLFASSQKVLAQKRSFGWHVVEFDFGEVTNDDAGTWSLKVTVNNSIQEIDFEVGENTEYSPRFYPLNGKSLRTDRLESGFTETLTFMHDHENLTLELVNAPSGVTLNGRDITINSPLIMSRNHLFKVIATDTKGRKDTMHYHLVDPLKQLNLLD